MIRRRKLRREKRRRGDSPRRRDAVALSVALAGRGAAGAGGASSLRMLGITSSHRGEGASTVAVQLAAAAARGGDRRVLLVDADFARPSLQRVFGLPLEPGLADVLREGEAAKPMSAQPRWPTCSCSRPAPERQAVAGLRRYGVGRGDQGIRGRFRPGCVRHAAGGRNELCPALAGLLDAVMLVVEADRVPAKVARRTAELLKRAQHVCWGLS